MMKRAFAAATAALTLTGALPAAHTATTQPNPRDCRSITIQIRHWGQTGPIRGTLCTPKGADTIQILAHGFTYDRRYWDWPQQPKRYSYADAANERGHATLAVDMLGAGDSWKPLGVTIGVSAQAHALHQVVQAVNQGRFGKFGSTVLAGHSMGTFASWVVAGRHPDSVDALIATGATHEIAATSVATKVSRAFYPAMLDPKFAGEVLDPMYWTTVPGQRKLMYNPPAADPVVIARDAELKQVGPEALIPTGIVQLVINESRSIEVPVLSVVGAYDPMFCKVVTGSDCRSGAALAADEAQYMPRAESVTGYVHPRMGHSVNLHRDAPAVFDRMLDWTEGRV